MFDTEDANRSFYNRILARFNKPPLTAEQFAFAQMHTVEEAMALLFPDASERRAAHDHRKAVGYRPFIPFMKMEPRLKPLLRRLRPAFKTAVATNRTDTLPHVLEEFDLNGDFDLVVSALDVDRPKPAPDQLIKIMRHFQISPEELIYVGDSQVDAAAARAAGVSFIAYGNPSLTADYHISGLKEIEDILSL